ncbi:MAG: lysophospholipid acyltransferase family protein [Brevinema sp.]
MAKRDFSISRKILMFIEAIFLLPLIYILSLLIPYRKIYSFSKIIGKILIKLNPQKKEIIDKNISIMNLALSEAEVQDLYYIMAGYELRIILEMIAFARMDFQEMLSYIRIQQHDQLSVIYHHNQNQNFVGFTLHFGNWELLGSFMAHLGYSLVCLVERQFNPWIDAHLQDLRRRLGMRTIYNEISKMKPLLQHMKAGGGVALVADQTYWFDPLFIPFFGREAAVPQGTASLAIKMNSQLFYGYTSFIGNGMYTIDFDTKVLANHVYNTEELIKAVYAQYEKIIVTSPFNWYTLASDRWGLTRDSLREWNKNPDSTRF